MEKMETIGQVSRTLGIPASTLRYWDQKGLLRFARNEQNGYRQFSFQTMMDICDIMLYRGMAVPIEALGQLARADTEAIQRTLLESQASLRLQMDGLRDTMANIQRRLAILEKLERLQTAAPHIERCRMESLKPFRFSDRDLVQKYLQAPYESVAVLYAPEYSKVAYGIFMPADTHVLRRADPGERPYLVGLVRVDAAHPSRHDAAALVEEARRQGYRPGDIIGRYLLTAFDAKRYDYYEGWLECLPT